MAYHSYIFIFIFLPITALLYYWIKRRNGSASGVALVIASALFYALGDLLYLPVLWTSIGFNYAVGKYIIRRAARQQPHRWVLAVGIIANLALLAVHKFNLLPVSRPPSLTDITALAHAGAIPLGMSFFTLQQITFLVDVSRDTRRQIGFWSYALYVTFFAQLIAGPIVRFARDGLQFSQLAKQPFDRQSIHRGLSLFIFGLAKKCLLADSLGSIVTPLFEQAATGETALSLGQSWLAAWGFLLQLYFDFSAYSDMAIGIGLIFGIALPINFNSPLRAVSATDCFNRWHITLTTFIRDFVFNPIFNWVRRLAVPLKRSKRNLLGWIVATLLSLTAVGVWHGAAPQFVVSGFLIGVVAVTLQLLSLQFKRPHRSNANRSLVRLANRIALLLALTYFGVFFRADGIGNAWSIIQSTWSLNTINLAQFTQSWSDLSGMKSALIILGGSIIALRFPNTNEIFIARSPTSDSPSAGWLMKRLHWRDTPIWALISGMLLMLSVGLIALRNPLPYIYGQF
ncbi:hypothetical protein MLD52_19700 [Puniceicoccaceae bacterium K14]|nr:hypothetical protein [Puniceicoccaceae bacterium K14]